MGFIKKIKNWFKKEPQSEILEVQEIELNTRKVLKDSNGEDLICCLCENFDNETNKYNPIYEGEKKMFNGKVWHLNCFRAFKKASKRGNLM